MTCSGLNHLFANPSPYTPPNPSTQPGSVLGGQVRSGHAPTPRFPNDGSPRPPEAARAEMAHLVLADSQQERRPVGGSAASFLPQRPPAQVSVVHFDKAASRCESLQILMACLTLCRISQVAFCCRSRLPASSKLYMPDLVWLTK
jgi:hypothetical protein